MLPACKNFSLYQHSILYLRLRYNRPDISIDSYINIHFKEKLSLLKQYQITGDKLKHILLNISPSRNVNDQKKDIIFAGVADFY